MLFHLLSNIRIYLAIAKYLLRRRKFGSADLKKISLYGKRVSLWGTVDISIYLSRGYTYTRYNFYAKAFFIRIQPRMDNDARGALLLTYAVYIPTAPR